MRLWSRFFWLQQAPTMLLALLVGWLAADFQLPPWATIITLAFLAHLAWAGTDAIFLALVWLLSLLWVGVVQFAWPMSLEPVGWSWLVMLSWTLNLALTWLIAVTLMFSLALTQRSLLQLGWNRRQTWQILVFLTWLSFGAGWMMSHTGWVKRWIAS